MLTLALFTLAAESDKKPSMAFLEYLASLEKVDGKLVGPMDMLDQDSQEKLKTDKPISKQINKTDAAEKALSEVKLTTENEGKEHE